MHLLVIDQLITPGKGRRTDGALEGLYSVVNALVAIQIAGRHKCSGTPWTDEWFVAAVYSHVLREVCIAGEGLLAHMTRVWTHSLDGIKIKVEKRKIYN